MFEGGNGVSFLVSPAPPPSALPQGCGKVPAFLPPSPGQPSDFCSTKLFPGTLDYPCPLTEQDLLFSPSPIPNLVLVLWNYFSEVTQ